ncbi:hypothetical protein AGIG_G3535 [Arapaima gigas]
MLVLFSEEAGGDFTDPTKPIRAPPPPSLGRILENIKCVCVLKAHSVLIYGPASDRCSREDSIRQLGPEDKAFCSRRTVTRPPPEQSDVRQPDV